MDDGNDDDEHDNEDQNNHNSAHFHDRMSWFCMVIDLDNTKMILPTRMTMMINDEHDDEVAIIGHFSSWDFHILHGNT